MEKGSLIFCILGSIVLILLISLLMMLVNIRKRTKAERAAVVVGQKLKESYRELEKAYEEVSATKNELNIKYEQLKCSQNKVKKMAYTDHLTQLPNRIAFVEMLDCMIQRLKKNEMIGLLDIDVDNFKVINDSLGHSYGDELLLDISYRLGQCLKKAIYLARIGGDEFAVLINGVYDVNVIKEVAVTIQKAFVQSFKVAMRDFFLTVSIGITIAPRDGKTTQHLLKNMNSAMYVAKESGKAQYCYFNTAINQKLVDKLELQSELHRAIEAKEFHVYYQAQIDLNNGKVVGFEALVRWIHPQKGVIPPNEFISAAEENSMIVEIGKMVFFEACSQLKEWQDKGYESLKLAVNFSARQFKDPNFLSMVYEVLNETKVNPACLDFEITETVALEDLDFTINTINQLKALGITFSLDDFGTGYSSLNYLKILPVNHLKIDKSFMDTILDSQRDRSIVNAMIELARNLDIDVIAEGVEHSEQELFLKKVQCNMAQGYFYSKPVPLKQANDILSRN